MAAPYAWATPLFASQIRGVLYILTHGGASPLLTLCRAGGVGFSPNNNKDIHMKHAQFVAILLIGCALIGCKSVSSNSRPTINATNEVNAITNTDINKQDSNGHTRLMRRAIAGDVEAVTDLIAEGADVNVKDNNGNTALMLALMYNRDNTVKSLIDAGTDVNAKNNDGNTALMICKSKASMKSLVDAGADVNAKDNSGKTALDYFVNKPTYFDHESIKWLIDAGAQAGNSTMNETRLAMFRDHDKNLDAFKDGKMPLITLPASTKTPIILAELEKFELNDNCHLISSQKSNSDYIVQLATCTNTATELIAFDEKIGSLGFTKCSEQNDVGCEYEIFCNDNIFIIIQDIHAATIEIYSLGNINTKHFAEWSHYTTNTQIDSLHTITTHDDDRALKVMWSKNRSGYEQTSDISDKKSNETDQYTFIRSNQSKKVVNELMIHNSSVTSALGLTDDALFDGY